MVMHHAAERVGVAEVQQDARHGHGALAAHPREDVFGVDVSAGARDRVDQNLRLRRREMGSTSLSMFSRRSRRGAAGRSTSGGSAACG